MSRLITKKGNKWRVILYLPIKTKKMKVFSQKSQKLITALSHVFTLNDQEVRQTMVV